MIAALPPRPILGSHIMVNHSATKPQLPEPPYKPYKGT